MDIFSLRHRLIPTGFFAALFISIGFTGFAFPYQTAASDFMAEGKKLYESRAEGCVGLQAKAETINTAIADFEKASAQGLEEEAGLYLMRCYKYKGRFVCVNGNDKKSTFEKGKNIGEKLIAKYPKSVPLLFEYLAVLGLWGNEIGAIQAAWDGLVGKLKGGAELLNKLDPNYAGCAGKMILGIINIRAPYIPLVLTWPSDVNGMNYLAEATKTAPGEFANLFFYGEALYKNGHKAEAKEYMRKVITMNPRPQLLLEDLQFKKDAEKLLKDWK